ncbi:unnamed protein product, partial [Symbiodinium sp. CCMP2456]
GEKTAKVKTEQQLSKEAINKGGAKILEAKGWRALLEDTATPANTKDSLLKDIQPFKNAMEQKKEELETFFASRKWPECTGSRLGLERAIADYNEAAKHIALHCGGGKKGTKK